MALTSSKRQKRLHPPERGIGFAGYGVDNSTAWAGTRRPRPLTPWLQPLWGLLVRVSPWSTTQGLRDSSLWYTANKNILQRLDRGESPFLNYASKFVSKLSVFGALLQLEAEHRQTRHRFHRGLQFTTSRRCRKPTLMLVYERHDRNNKISQLKIKWWCVVCDVREQCCRPLRKSATN